MIPTCTFSLLLLLMLPSPQPSAVSLAPFMLFSRLSLAQAQQMALPLAPALLDAQARLLESKYNLAAARAGIAPSFTAGYTQGPQGNPPGPNIISRASTVGIQTTLGDFLAYAPSVREAALSLEAAQADEAAAQASERIKIVNLYYGALASRAILQARRSALELALTQRRAANIRNAAGDAPRLDVVRADAAIARATADLETATAADLNASEALRAETNCSREALATTEPQTLAPSNPLLTDPQTALALARRFRPEIRSAQRTLQAAREAILVARASGFPTLTLNGGYTVGTDSGVPINGPAITAQLTFPLSSATHDKVSIAAARALQAQAKALDVQRTVELEVSAAARTLGASERAAGAMSRARQAAQEQLQATELGYSSGVSSSLEVSSARAGYTQTRIDELSALYDALKAGAILDIEVGRG